MDWCRNDKRKQENNSRDDAATRLSILIDPSGGGRCRKQDDRRNLRKIDEILESERIEEIRQ